MLKSLSVLISEKFGCGIFKLYKKFSVLKVLKIIWTDGTSCDMHYRFARPNGQNGDYVHMVHVEGLRKGSL